MLIIDRATKYQRDPYFERFSQGELTRAKKWRESQPINEPIRLADRTDEYIKRRNILDGI